MPVLVFVRQILGINSDSLVAFLANIGKDGLVALDAVGMVVSQHIALSGQRLVALPAAEVARVPVLRHRLRVFSAMVVGDVVFLLDLCDGYVAIIRTLSSFACFLHLTNFSLCCELHLNF